jgi:hypothetical protein
MATTAVVTGSVVNEAGQVAPPSRDGTHSIAIPDDIWIAVLSWLPDYESLSAATIVSHQLRDCAAIACRQVMLNQIGYDVFPEAIMASESTKVKSYDPIRIAKFSNIFVKRRVDIDRPLALRDALRMSTLHRSVSHFVERFSNVAMRRLYEECAKFNENPTLRLTPKPPSQYSELFTASAAERARFARSFYYFETYCNLFKEPNHIRYLPSAWNVQREQFFQHLTPWEREQFAAVKDYLAAAVLEPRTLALL